MLGIREIGIDLGSHSIKIAMIDKTGRSKNSLGPVLSRLEASEVYPVSCPQFSKEYYALLKNSLKSFSKKHKLTRLSLNISIAIDKDTSNVQFMNVPVVDKKLLESAISFEAEQKMSAEGITDSFSTWKKISTDNISKEHEVLLASIKKDVVNSLAQFKTVKWKINRVLLQPILLERACSSNDVVIDLGYKSTRVYLYLAGKLAQTEVIEVGGKDILETVDEYLKDNFINDVNSEDLIKHISVYSDALLTGGTVASAAADDWYGNIDTVDEVDEDIYGDLIEESEPEVTFEDEVTQEINYENEVTPEINYGKDEDSKVEFPLEPNEIAEDSENPESTIETEEVKYSEELLSALSTEIDKKMNRIFDEVKRIVRMYELQNGVETDEVFYLGQLANLNYLKETLEAELEMNLKPVDVLDISSEVEEELTLYSLASLVSLDPKLKDETNFSKFIKANVDYTSIIIMVVAVSLSTGIALKLVGDNYSEQIDELQATNSEQLNTISQIDSEIASIESEMEDTSKFLERMKALRDQKNWLSDMLYLVPEMTPITVSLENMDIKDGEIVLNGYSADYSSIGFLANKLKDISDVNIDSIDELEDQEIYSVTMDNPALISDKYKISQKFQMTLLFDDTLLDHGDDLFETEGLSDGEIILPEDEILEEGVFEDVTLPDETVEGDSSLN